MLQCRLRMHQFSMDPSITLLLCPHSLLLLLLWWRQRLCASRCAVAVVLHWLWHASRQPAAPRPPAAARLVAAVGEGPPHVHQAPALPCQAVEGLGGRGACGWPDLGGLDAWRQGASSWDTRGCDASRRGCPCSSSSTLRLRCKITAACQPLPGCTTQRMSSWRAHCTQSVPGTHAATNRPSLTRMHTAATHLGRVGAGGQAAVCLALERQARWRAARRAAGQPGEVERPVSRGPRLGLLV